MHNAHTNRHKALPFFPRADFIRQNGVLIFPRAGNKTTPNRSAIPGCPPRAKSIPGHNMSINNGASGAVCRLMEIFDGAGLSIVGIKGKMFTHARARARSERVAEGRTGPAPYTRNLIIMEAAAKLNAVSRTKQKLLSVE